MVDIIIILFIGLFILFGFFRGVISQLMAIVGFVAAYFFAKPASIILDEPVSKHLGSTQVYGKPFSIFLAGLGIYILCRVLGYLFEKLFVRDDSIQMLNRIGGGFFGGLKGLCILLVVFYVLKFIPEDVLKERAPKLAQSKTYQFFNEYQILDPKYLELLKTHEAMIPEKVEEMKKSVTTSAAAKVIQKTESKMNNDDLSKELSKHVDATKAKPSTSKKK